MSLLGRLEDLSLTDIIQIVYLSRRTGVLEIVDDRGRHTVLFRHGLIVNASSPEHPDLVSWLEKSMAIPSAAASTLRQNSRHAAYSSGATRPRLISSTERTVTLRPCVSTVSW